MLIEFDLLKKKAVESDWLNTLVVRGEKNLRYTSWPSMVLQPHTWTLGIVVFIDGDANMNNSRGRTGIYPSAGLRATCLSRVRKNIWIWSLRVAVDENWHPLCFTLFFFFISHHATTSSCFI